MAERKAIWGSTRYFIEIEPNTNLFNTAMSGLVQFFDTRDLLNEKECENLHELVRTVFDFWSTILPPHETRVARWLDEYFQNMGIRSDYGLLLRLIRAEEMIEEQLEDIILETLKISTENLRVAFNVEDDVSIIGRLTKIKQLPEDEFVMNELIQKLIEINQITVPSTIKGTHQFNIVDGDKKSIEIMKHVNIGETIGAYSVTTNVINRYDTKMTDIEIIDEVPYSYKILMSNVDKEGVEKDQIRGDESLIVKWKIPDLDPKDRVEITYHLKRRINRIIIEVDEKEVTILKTFENINPADLEYKANTHYINTQSKELKELYIADTIPPEFNILKTIPEAIAPQGIIERAKMKGITIRWKHKNVKAEDIIEKKYNLDYFSYLFRGKKLVTDKEGNNILKSLKILQPSARESGYKILYVIRALSHIEEVISLTDKIPADHVIVNTSPVESQIMEEASDENHKYITWVTNPPKRNEDSTVLLTISGETQPVFELFQIQIGDTEEGEVEEKISNIERELLAFNLDQYT
jgi:hypothetical protein